MKRFCLFIVFILLSFQSSGQINDFFGVPVTDCNSTKDAIIEKFGTKDTAVLNKESTSGISGFCITDIMLPGIGIVAVGISSPNTVHNINELGKCAAFIVSTNHKYIHELEDIASVLESHYGFTFGVDEKPGAYRRFIYPDGAKLSESIASVNYLNGRKIYFRLNIK